jgi:hypothetical protein
VNRIARMPARDRADVFAETAERKGLSDAIIEKDFWVCWTLKQLFSIEALSGRGHVNHLLGKLQSSYCLG